MSATLSASSCAGSTRASKAGVRSIITQGSRLDARLEAGHDEAAAVTAAAQSPIAARLAARERAAPPASNSTSVVTVRTQHAPGDEVALLVRPVD